MVPPVSHRVPRVRRYSGFSSLSSLFAYRTLTFCGRSSHTFPLSYFHLQLSATPRAFLPSVWPMARSIASTCAISVDFSSSPYLDVSVQAVPSVYLCIQYTVRRRYPAGVSPFGYPRIDAYLRLPVAFRSLSRPSSAPSAKASPLRSLYLDLRLTDSSVLIMWVLFALAKIVS